MKLELKSFQQLATDELLTHLRSARRDAPSFPQAILLSAPTGAGKTVIATAVLEALIEGDDEAPGQAQTTVLWLTDQPELNEQTRRKMRGCSSSLDDSRLTTIEQDFPERILPPGRVYFLNTQKLGRHSGLVTPKDQRPWTLWDVLRDTMAARPQDFLLVIDEAHRGMAETEKDREQAQTIVQRFIKGNDDFLPARIILGISATPQRFLNMVAGKRNLRPQVDIPAQDVRDSGLLKQTLLVYHPTKREPSDFTLLRAAAERHGEYRDEWAQYRARSQSAESVEPILVVQVANAPSGRRAIVTDTDLAMSVSVIEGVLGSLDEAAMGHAFQEGIAVPIGDGRSLRHVAPSDIQDDPGLKLVFFKTALTTGWDCPRAEVMMSFRRAVDHTTIAQLVGRMVRTPLARTVEDDEFLNTVSLYLPHYDKAGLDKVLDRLQKEDPEFLPPVDVRRGTERARLHRDQNKADCFLALERVPTYDVARVRATTNVRRALKLVRHLDRDRITTGALEELHCEVVRVLQEARARLETSSWWANLVKDAGTIDLRTVEWALGVGPISEQQSLVQVTPQNIDDLFAAAGRRLGDGLHKVYWRARATEDPGVMHRIAKLEVFALSQHRQTETALEALAESAIERLQAAHGADIEALPRDRQDGYRQVRMTARDPQARALGAFENIEGRAFGSAWEHHLYVDENEQFLYDFTSSWEALVLKAAMVEPGFLGWLRIEDRKDWALTIPYRMMGEVRPMYPDFLVFRHAGDRVVVDIVDPHDPTRDDWLPKVKGLAEYATKHWPRFGRIEASFVDKKTIRRLDLAVERNRTAALQADGAHSLRALFTSS